jgi:hypothetical protein
MAERKSLLLRIRPELWEELNRWAAEEFRSVNGQIEFLLQRASDERFGKRASKGDDRTAKGRRGGR